MSVVRPVVVQRKYLPVHRGNPSTFSACNPREAARHREPETTFRSGDTAPRPAIVLTATSGWVCNLTVTSGGRRPAPIPFTTTRFAMAEETVSLSTPPLTEITREIETKHVLRMRHAKSSSNL